MLKRNQEHEQRNVAGCCVRSFGKEMRKKEWTFWGKGDMIESGWESATPLHHNRLTTKRRTDMLFLQYPPCSTCQKAKKWLDEQGLSYTDRHIKLENPSYEELKSWYTLSGLPLKKFFNTSGLLYKSLNLKEKLPDMSEEEQLRLLASDGMLVKRPLFVGTDFVLVGFREAEWKGMLSLQK